MNAIQSARRALATVMLCGLGVLPATTVARAASVTSLDFVAAAGPDNDFLVASDDLAASNAGSARVVAFARREAAGRRHIAAEIVDWSTAAKRADREADLGPSLDRLGQIFGPGDRSVTVAIVPVARAEAETIRRLSGTTGAAFDDIFVASQARALTHLVAAYVDFIQNGDDETLRALAVHDLPRVRGLLAEVRRFK